MEFQYFWRIRSASLADMKRISIRITILFKINEITEFTNANDVALAMMLDGKVDGVWLYAD